MADVQLEKGYYKVANDLDAAILYAPFSASQLKIVRAIVRLSYGWKERTVRISLTKLAECCDLRPTGGFHRAFAELIEHRVVFEVQRGTGRRPSLYAINKNYETWGRFIVHPDRLVALFGKRPPSDEELFKAFLKNGSIPPQGHTTDDRSDDSSIEEDDRSTPPQGITTERSTPPQGTATLPPSEPVALPRGSTSTPKGESMTPTGELVHIVSPLEINHLGSRKDSERQEKQTTTTNNPGADGGDSASRDPDDAIQRFAIGMSTAANAAITARFGEQPNPIHFRTGLESARLLIAKGVALETARSAIVGVVERYKGERPPTTLAYFFDAILRVQGFRDQRRINAGDPSVPKAPELRGGAPVGTAVLVNVTGQADLVRQEKVDLAEYEVARKEAAGVWSADPANEGELRLILAAANEANRDLLMYPYGKQARDRAVDRACVERSGFPSTFDAWRKARTRPP